VDLARFSETAKADRPTHHVILSPGRLVWEKGHQDVLRAVALLHRDIVTNDDGVPVRPRVLFVGSGPEKRRLGAYARELGIAEAVEFRDFVPYRDMPSVFASASCLVLASLPTWYWEEQFGLVLAEGMAAGLPIIASTSGAIPEVVGAGGAYFAPGDWLGLAQQLVAGPLSQPPGQRVEHDPRLVERYTLESAADRLAAAYDHVLSAA
jgi:glycosyltransferase involved in cell wall biosynthesis